MERIIRISPDGKELMFLYDDSLMEGENKRVVRASDVKFHEEDQLWRVHELFADGSEKEHEEGFTSRAEAIQFEIGLLEARLEKNPESVGEMFR